MLGEAYDRTEEDSEGQYDNVQSHLKMVIEQKKLILCLRIKNSRGMTVKPSWLRSMRCAVLLTGSLRADHWPWGLAYHGVHLFAPPLCKKYIWEPTAFIATPAKSLHGNRKNP